MDAAEPHQNNGAPLQVVTSTNDELDATLTHAFDQNALEDQSGLAPGEIVISRCQPAISEGRSLKPSTTPPASLLCDRSTD